MDGSIDITTDGAALARFPLRSDWPTTEDLPPEAPLAMPVQDLSIPFKRTEATTGARDLKGRRIVMFGVAGLMALLADYGAWNTFIASGLTVLNVFSLLLFMALTAGMAIWFCSAVSGLRVLMKSEDARFPLGLEPDAPLPVLVQRTAILCPVRNEDPDAVFGRLAAMDNALGRLGVAPLFDIFVLSDTNTAEIARHERQRFTAMRRTSACQVYYRRRTDNAGKKAGNVGEWVRRFGAAYENMLVLDADSVMTGEAMVRLAGAMQRNPRVGLIQTMPTVTAGRTFFARWLQYCTRLYGFVAATGLTWWTGSEGVYWGHNAIIRTRAFAESAGLPKIKGKGPSAGEIMSHDSVEAALMRRRGWGIHLAPLVEGSYEEVPPTLCEFSARDRRWCQGNVQHLRLLATPGLHWTHRFQLFLGAMGYTTSPLWLMSLIAGVVRGLGSVERAPVQHLSFVEYCGLVMKIAMKCSDTFLQSIWLLGLTTFLLLAPKFFGFALIMARKAERAAFGGAWTLIKGLVVDLAVSCALAPIMMVSQTRALVEILVGQDAGWKLQNRTAAGMTWGEAIRLYRLHVAAGVCLCALVSGAPGLALWMAPVVGPLLFAPAIVRFISRDNIGEAARKAGVFLTPEEVFPPAILTEAVEMADPSEPEIAVAA